MGKISVIFDYMKIAFKLNKNNRKLYLPQIALILFKTFFYIVYGVMLFNFILSIDDPSFTEKSIFVFLIDTAKWIITVVLIYGIGGLVVESGLYNMYKQCLAEGELREGVFAEGVRKYFMKFLLVNIIMIGFWIVALIPFVIASLITLAVGFVLIPLLVSIFTAMWKVMIVMDDSGVSESLRKSFSFAKLHFIPLGALIIIREAFSSISSGGGSSGSSANQMNSGSGQQQFGDFGTQGIKNINFEFYDWYSEILPYIKTGFYVLIPVISVAVIVSSLIKMIFEIFFGLTLFVMYSENLVEEKNLLTKEVL